MTALKFKIGDKVRVEDQTLRIAGFTDTEYRVFVIYPYAKYEWHSQAYLNEHGKLVESG